MMSPESFLILNMALAFYNVGTIWAHEVDIFRHWTLLDPPAFHKVQEAHWRKIPYWIFIPVGLSFAGAVALFWYHPPAIRAWETGTAFSLLGLSNLLTACCWGPWQAKLSKDPSGGQSPYLRRILRTHWIRTTLITAYGLALLGLVFQSF